MGLISRVSSRTYRNTPFTTAIHPGVLRATKPTRVAIISSNSTQIKKVTSQLLQDPNIKEIRFVTDSQNFDEISHRIFPVDDSFAGQLTQSQLIKRRATNFKSDND